ncbi:carboxymuconolactone decarboxylase family protein [Minwuia sp.]|uniref:carboxymuconolactone decarboxylase family protein n=1 Tax=Minwuia sp. TaxID=2493630 RepID=UPI003A8E0B1C
MARIPYVDPADAPEEIASLLAKLPPMNVMRMLAHAEPEFRKFVSFSDALLRKSDVDKWLLELAILRVGHLSEAPYEIHQHEALARAVGGTDDKIAAIADGANNDLFSEDEKLVLRYTDDVVRNVRASDATFKPLEAKLSHQGLVELTMAIGFYMMVSRLLNTFDVEIEDGGDTTLTLER